LSTSIVVKENKKRYQKEQFERMLVASQFYSLKKKTNTMEEFCVNYSKLVEDMVAESNNYRCPKIQANYSDFNE
jgi:hypothetical protein